MTSKFRSHDDSAPSAALTIATCGQALIKLQVYSCEFGMLLRIGKGQAILRAPILRAFQLG